MPESNVIVNIIAKYMEQGAITLGEQVKRIENRLGSVNTEWKKSDNLVDQYLDRIKNIEGHFVGIQTNLKRVGATTSSARTAMAEWEGHQATMTDLIKGSTTPVMEILNTQLASRKALEDQLIAQIEANEVSRANLGVEKEKLLVAINSTKALGLQGVKYSDALADQKAQLSGIDSQIETSTKKSLNLLRLIEMTQAKRVNTEADIAKVTQVSEAELKKYRDTVNVTKMTMGRFRMEMLGMMFAGMNLYRSQAKWLQQALQDYEKLYGKYSPIMMKIQKTTDLQSKWRAEQIKALKGFYDMDYAITKMVSSMGPLVTQFIAIGRIGLMSFGKVLMIIGQMGLGISSSISAARTFIAWIKGIGAAEALEASRIAATTAATEGLTAANYRLATSYGAVASAANTAAGAQTAVATAGTAQIATTAAQTAQLGNAISGASLATGGLAVSTKAATTATGGLLAKITLLGSKFAGVIGLYLAAKSFQNMFYKSGNAIIKFAGTFSKASEALVMGNLAGFRKYVTELFAIIKGKSAAAKKAGSAAGEAIADGIADYTKASSPPKKGPLHTMDRWGGEYSKMIGEGIVRRRGYVEYGADVLANTMAERTADIYDTISGISTAAAGAPPEIEIAEPEEDNFWGWLWKTVTGVLTPVPFKQPVDTGEITGPLGTIISGGEFGLKIALNPLAAAKDVVDAIWNGIKGLGSADNKVALDKSSVTTAYEDVNSLTTLLQETYGRGGAYPVTITDTTGTVTSNITNLQNYLNQTQWAKDLKLSTSGSGDIAKALADIRQKLTDAGIPITDTEWEKLLLLMADPTKKAELADYLAALKAKLTPEQWELIVKALLNEGGKLPTEAGGSLTGWINWLRAKVDDVWNFTITVGYTAVTMAKDAFNTLLDTAKTVVGGIMTKFEESGLVGLITGGPATKTINMTGQVSLGYGPGVVALNETIINYGTVLKGRIGETNDLLRDVKGRIGETNNVLYYINGNIITMSGRIGETNSILYSMNEKLSGITAMQAGGSIPATGLYMLHAGEYVSPAGAPAGTGFNGSISVTVNLNTTINSELDVKRIAKIVGDEISRDIERRVGAF